MGHCKNLTIIEGFISKVTYLKFLKIWSWAYQGIKYTLFYGIHYVFCWKRRKYQFQEPLKVRVISKVTHIPAVFISKESYFPMANRNSLRYHMSTICIMAVVAVLCFLIITKSSHDEIGCREFAPVLKCFWPPPLLSTLYWTKRKEYVGNFSIYPLGTPFSSIHGSTHYLQMTKLEYVNSSTTIELQIKKWQSIN